MGDKVAKSKEIKNKANKQTSLLIGEELGGKRDDDGTVDISPVPFSHRSASSLIFCESKRVVDGISEQELDSRGQILSFTNPFPCSAVRSDHMISACSMRDEGGESHL